MNRAASKKQIPISNWTVKRGQHWAILGANGSGKTSLLSVLTGYLTPTLGTITLLQKRYGQTDWRELRKQVELVSSSIRQMIAEAEKSSALTSRLFTEAFNTRIRLTRKQGRHSLLVSPRRDVVI